MGVWLGNGVKVGKRVGVSVTSTTLVGATGLDVASWEGSVVGGTSCVGEAVGVSGVSLVGRGVLVS